MSRTSTSLLAAWVGLLAASGAARAGQPDLVAPPRDAGPPVFRPAERAVSTWRTEASDHLTVTEEQADALRGHGAAPPVARCVKLNNYWCIKKAGWNGEIAADGDGHVAFASALEGAAVAAILLKRYYLDFHRRTALAIVSRWAPAQCGATAFAPVRARRGSRSLALAGIPSTLRARWLASHSRGFVVPRAGSLTQVRRSVVTARLSRLGPPPTIAVGLGEAAGSTRAMTLDALLASSPNAPASRSLIGVPRGRPSSILAGGVDAGSGFATACGGDDARLAAYAAAAAVGIATAPDGDLALFSPEGAPTPNLAAMMANMARVEIGPLGAKPTLIGAGIAEAFRPGRNPESR